MSLGVGAYHTCAVLADGAVDCWGYNAYGQLGTGDAEDRLIPTMVVGLRPGSSGRCISDSAQTIGSLACAYLLVS